MARKLVKVKLHGILGEKVNSSWDLAVNSLPEALRFVEMNTKKLYKTFYEFDQQNIKFCVIINGRNFHTDNPPDINNPESIINSELLIKKKDLETIDIVPVIEGAGSDALGIFTAILGVILIIIGAFTGGALIPVGLALLAAGVFTLLSKPPKFEDFREIEQGGKTSYLFSGPANIVGEGGPVPVGYGRLIVGSQVISASYVIRDFNTADTSIVLRDEYGNLTYIPPKKTKVYKECCFIFIQGESELTQFVRNYRDSHYGNDSMVANGYRWMAGWIVPLMKKYSFIQYGIKYSMTSPLSRYVEWYYKNNNYGWIY